MSEISDADFLSEDERELAHRFLNTGYIIQPADDRDELDRIRELLVTTACTLLEQPLPADCTAFLEGINKLVPIERLNPFHLGIIEAMNAAPWLRRAYFRTARSLIEALVGNELVMQRRINLSIQLPGDESSLLPVHADVWSGDSPFELVLWLPLVDCHASKSMYLMAPAAASELYRDFANHQTTSAEDLYRAIKPSVTFLDVPYGQVLAFDQSLPHGNRVNRELGTRWSLNCRFKAAFTPYADKKLGEFFSPITLRPMSRIGLAYRSPGDFHE